MGCGEVWGGIGTAQLWGLRLQSSLGWLAPPLLGILEGDRQRVVGSSVTLGVGGPRTWAWPPLASPSHLPWAISSAPGAMIISTI